MSYPAQNYAYNREVATRAMRAKLTLMFKNVAIAAIAKFSSGAATNRFTCYDQYINNDNESRLGICVMSLGDDGVAGDICVTLRGMTRAGACWGDFILTVGASDVEGTGDSHNALSVVELAPMLAAAQNALTQLATGFPADAVTGTKAETDPLVAQLPRLPTPTPST